MKYVYSKLGTRPIHLTWLAGYAKLAKQGAPGVTADSRCRFRLVHEWPDLVAGLRLKDVRRWYRPCGHVQLHAFNDPVVTVEPTSVSKLASFAQARYPAVGIYKERFRFVSREAFCWHGRSGSCLCQTRLQGPVSLSLAMLQEISGKFQAVQTLSRQARQVLIDSCPVSVV